MALTRQILLISGDGGESYEAWYSVHRFREAGFTPRVAAPSKRRLHLVIHDFEPGWDTYKEREGYAMSSDLTFDEVRVDDYEAVVCLGGRAPEYLRNDARVIDIVRQFDGRGKWVFAICHGVQIPAAAGLLKGKEACCYEHVRLDVETTGARFNPGQAVRDGRIVTGATWQSHPEFYREVFACLGD
jgi:protease I